MGQQRPDPYAVLGVTRSASAAEISHAYRLLLRRHHPDTRDHQEASASGAADAELERIIAAYGVLRDPESRARYNQQNSPAPTVASRSGQRRPTPSTRPPIVAGPVRWHNSVWRTEKHA
ncbi:MAG: J domain-containing protein [Marmoricola sp.]